MGLIAVEQQHNTPTQNYPTHKHSSCTWIVLRSGWLIMLIANHSSAVMCLQRGLMCFLLLRHKPPLDGSSVSFCAPEGKRTVPSSILPNPLPLDRKEDKYCCRCLTLCKWDFSSQIYQALAGCLKLRKLGPQHDKMAAHVSESPTAVLLPKGYDDIVKSVFSCCANFESLISNQRSKWSSGLFIFGKSPCMRKEFLCVCVRACVCRSSTYSLLDFFV